MLKLACYTSIEKKHKWNTRRSSHGKVEAKRFVTNQQFNTNSTVSGPHWNLNKV